MSLQSRAYETVKQAVLQGKLPDLKAQRIRCVDCGAAAVFYDHRDYTKPLAVDPVCRSCNYRRGRALGAPDGIRLNVDLPEELYRKVKAAAALRGMTIQQWVEEALKKITA